MTYHENTAPPLPHAGLHEIALDPIAHNGFDKDLEIHQALWRKENAKSASTMNNKLGPTLGTPSRLPKPETLNPKP
jgi:hypothetical protein